MCAMNGAENAKPGSRQVSAASDASRALEALRAQPAGREAAIIGRVQEQPVRVLLETTIGGERVIEELEDDPLPRIC